jgi:hypothetical protein
MNYKLTSMWKQAIVTYIEILFFNFPGGTKKNQKTLSQDSQALDQVLQFTSTN